MNVSTTELSSAGRSIGKRKKKKWFLLLLLLVLLAAGGFGIYRMFFTEEEKIPLTGTTTYGALNNAIEGSGTTTPADSVTYSINGTVLEWYAQPGNAVQAGDLLYVLDSSEVEDEILEYEVELEDLYENLDELQESINSRLVTAPFSGRIENIQTEEGKTVHLDAALATLVDSSTMQATLYFSYTYESEIQKGTDVVISVPEQMMTLSGTVSQIHYVDYVTPSGMRCFSTEVLIDNPGSLTEGTAVTGWIKTADGTCIYASNDGRLEYNAAETITAGASGEVLTINVVDYQRVTKGEILFTIDTSGYETQLETLQKQIENYEEKIADLKESIATEYTRYADISGQVVSADYSTNRITGTDVGVVTIYNQETMEISINVDELDADYLNVGMDVYVYRTTSSKTVSYPATLSYLSLEATSGSSGVSTFAATITIDSAGALSSGVTVYYSISPNTGSADETVLAPINALFSYDDGYYLLMQADSAPENAIDPAAEGGSVTDYPDGYYAVPVEIGDYNGNYIQILSGADKDATLFLRYMNAAPSGGDSTSSVGNSGENTGMPDFGNMNSMPSFGGNGMADFGGGMPSTGGGMPSMGGGMPSMGGR